MRVMNTHLAAHSITQGRFLVLMLLMDKGVDCPRPTTPGELADMASVSRATITGLLDTLERDALVRREPHPDDRRQMSIHLTPKAQTLMQEILPGHFRLINQLMGSLSDNERRTLVRLLAKVSAQAAAVAPGHAVPASEACPAGGTHS